VSEDPTFPETNETPDQELVERVQGGDVAAFDELIIRYQSRIYSVIYNMTSNHEDTNDRMMETFDRAFRKIGSFKNDSSFYTWIYRIAINQTINFTSKNKKRLNQTNYNAVDLDSLQESELLDSLKSSTPDGNLEIKDLQNKLNESLQKLSEEHRAVVVLFDVEGLSHAEIGKILDCTEGTVRSRLHYAHKQLQKFLEPYLKANL
jgi:RNA polymerase sigma-70 factor (ECF subfamily)